jgi:hypothetical protein
LDVSSVTPDCNARLGGTATRPPRPAARPELPRAMRGSLINALFMYKATCKVTDEFPLYAFTSEALHPSEACTQLNPKAISPIFIALPLG